MSTHDTVPFSIHVHAARLVYDGRPLFDSLDFTLEGGRWTSILGPSGVGKTTLLRLIAGLARAENGNRVACSDGASLAGRIAYMAQQDLLLPWLDAIGNVTLGARLRASPPDTERGRKLLDAVGLGSRLDALPRQLSGGERQRVALARTLFENRPVILMDEPFSALDALTRLRLQDLAARLLRGRTVLLVTHDPVEALRLSDSIRVMAGNPARLVPAEMPGSAIPRSPQDPELVRHYGELLSLLGTAGATEAVP